MYIIIILTFGFDFNALSDLNSAVSYAALARPSTGCLAADEWWSSLTAQGCSQQQEETTRDSHFEFVWEKEIIAYWWMFSVSWFSFLFRLWFFVTKKNNAIAPVNWLKLWLIAYCVFEMLLHLVLVNFILID